MLEATKVKEYKSIKPNKFYWLANLKDCRAVGSCFVTMLSEGSWTFCSLAFFVLEATKVKEYKSIKPNKFYWLANLKDCRAVGSCFVTMFSEGSWTFCSLTSLCSRRRRLRNINL